MNWKSYSWGCLTSFLLLFILLATCVLFAFHNISHLHGKQKSLQDSAYLLIDLSSEIIDYRQESSPLWSDKLPLALNLLRSKLTSATKDPQVKGIVLKVSGYSPLSYSHADELAHLLQKFQTQSGKKVFAYIYSCTDSKFLLSSCAEQIFLNPSAAAGISFLGINAKKVFLHSFLEKIGIQVKVVRTGDYKSFGQSFTRDSMSSIAQAEIRKVYGSLFARYQKQLASNLALSTAEVSKIFDQNSKLTFSGESALNLVDSLAYYQDFLDAKNIKNILSIDKYQPKNQESKAKNKIAVVYLSGSIVFDSNSPEQEIDLQSTQDIFAKIKEDETVKAVVVRINSPGGSALASHLIAEQVIKRCTLPIVVSMGSVAASGGYYIASASDYIVADPYSITGSIGVCALLPNIHGLGEKLGINYSGVSFGEFSQSMDISKPHSPQLLSAIQSHIEDVYQEFCYCVARGRNLPLPKVKNLAQGKIYTAEQAKDLHLIDQVGYLEDAIAKAKELSKTEEAELAFYPTQDNWLKTLLRAKLGKVPFLKVLFATHNSLENKDYIQARLW